MGDLDQCPGLLDLGDVSHDLEALSPLNTDRDRAIRTTELSEDSAAEHEYDNISSPGGSSTCSGPTYKRHLGFGPTESARPFPSANVIKVEDVIVSPPSPLKQAVSQPGISSLPSRHRLSSQTSLEPRPKESRKKKKKTLLSPSYDENSLEQSTQILENDKPNTKTGKFGVTRSRHKKEPLPMKMRALPQSFWQQPNNANPLSPGAVYSRLPPLPGQTAHEEDILDHVPALTEVAGEEAEQMMEARPRPEHRVTEANTDLLFSLFNGVEEDDSQRKIHLVRRGRPRKPPPVFSRTRMLQDEDPCLVSTMTESILPLIPERTGPSLQNNNNKIGGGGGNVGTQVIKIMSISAGDKSVDLPSLNIEHNYPHLLSELVMKL